MTNTPTSHQNGTMLPSRQDSSQPIITIRIESGPVSSAQKTAGRKFWQRIIASVKEDIEGDRHG